MLQDVSECIAPKTLRRSFAQRPYGDGRDSKSKPNNQQPMNQNKVSTIGPTVAETPSGNPASGGLQEAAKEATSAAQTEFEKLRGAAREQGSAAVKEIKTAAESTAREAQQAGSDFIHEQKANLAQKVELCGGSSWGVEEAAR